jgi:hypothetical protein
MNKIINLGTLICVLSSSALLGRKPIILNYTDIYVKNPTKYPVTIGEQKYWKEGFAEAGQATKIKPGFIIKPGKRAKVASLDRDQALYPDEINYQYPDKYASVSFSIAGTPYTFTSRWENPNKTKRYSKIPSKPQEKTATELSSILTINDSHLWSKTDYVTNQVIISSYYVFLKLYHDLEIKIR